MGYIKTRCVICGTFDNSIEICPENIDNSSTTPEVFSARRLPDRRYYRWVKCRICSLFRSDPVLDIDLNELYMKSTFDYGSEILGLQKTYGRLILKAFRPSKPLGKILEIGGGSGFFLEEALRIGFNSILGIEPSIAAVESANPKIKEYLRVSMFDDNSAQDDSCEAIAIFHTLDHLEQPIEVLKVAHKKLRKNGRIIIAVHNVEAFTARVLKKRSPIFDVEHTFLFSPKTLRAVLELAGFKDIKVGAYCNFYSLSYITHLLPIPRTLKEGILNSRFNSLLVKFKLWIPLGNISASGVKRT